MKTLYIECNMGVAGDMLMGALLELAKDKEGFIDKMNHLGIPRVKICSSESIKCGICGTHISVKIDGQEETDAEHHKHEISVEHHHEHIHGNHAHSHEENVHHHHATMESIGEIIDSMEIPDNVKKDIKSIYQIIADAESKVHGKPVGEVHFHEVGMMDAIADITGCCLLINEINPERIIVSPIVTGFGHVHCAHGTMPVPAPATALILNGVPNCTGDIEGELCTPTGAAIVKYFADEFSYQPEMVTDKIGYGMGTKDFLSVNCVRAFIGDTKDISEEIIELCCNIDDMTPEDIGYATELFMENGAVDVYTTSIGMKKSRPGIMLNVMCRSEDKERIAKLIFQHTTTIGIRQYTCNRMTLRRRKEFVNTKFGKVRVKRSEGYGVEREKAEYEDIRNIANNTGMSLMEIRRRLNL